MSFTSVPILNYSLVSSPQSKPQFISQLRHALVNIGFLYLSNTPVSPTLISSLQSHIPHLFTLDQSKKDGLRMANSPHFLGYSRLGSELTKERVDYREQWDFGTEHVCRWKEGRESYWRLWGPSQWPAEDDIPGFKQMFQTYLQQVQALSRDFVSLLSEAFGLGTDGLVHFYDEDELMQHRAKIVKYPTVQNNEDGKNQGVGPHYDAGFLTFLLQASDHHGLQVQNISGQWIDVPPIDGTFVVNIGKALEFVTKGLARATCHRVLSPKGDTPRYSVPFFQNISMRIRLCEHVLSFPPEVLKLKEERGETASTEAANFTEFDKEPCGMVFLIGRIKSHPDVAQRFYPELFEKYSPNGLPLHGSAY